MAFQKYLKRQQQQPEPLPITSPPLESPEQLFFLGFAQSWCRTYQPKALHQLLLTDVHSPSRARVNGPLRNRPEFAAAFKCPSGSPMNPTRKCSIW